MKFRLSPYYLFMYFTGIAFSASVAVGGIVLIIIDPHDNIEIPLLQILLGGIILFETIRKMRPISCPWIFFSNQGVTKHLYFGNHTFIPWKKCTEIGVISAKFAGGRHHGPLNWIYFSNTSLSYDQSCVRKMLDLKSSDLIIVQYYPDVLNELLKYIPKDQIRNLHLIGE